MRQKNMLLYLDYNYQSSEWYERSYKILNKNYKKPKIKKDLKKQKSLLKNLKNYLNNKINERK